MEFIKPTYEGYCKATEFARFRYRFGIYIQIVAAILLLFLVYYTVTNIEEMKANPIDYAEKNMGVSCFTPMAIEINNEVDDGSYRNIEYIKIK